MIVEPNKNKVIHESYKDLMARHRKNEMAKQYAALEKLQALKPKYVKKGYKIIHVTYSGCGDSGEVTEVYATVKGDIDEGTHQFNYKDDEYDEISEIVYDLLTYDWYNNDGGGGTVDINFNRGEVGIDAYYIIEEHAKSEEQTPHFTF